jgi:hypothetical protein
MEANDIADAVGDLSISDNRDRRGVPIYQEGEQQYPSSRQSRKKLDFERR